MNKKHWLAFTLIVILTAMVASACVVQPAVQAPQEAAEEPAAEEAVEEAEVAEEAESAAEEEAVKIVWWSHWAEETNKRAVLEQVAADYMAENPNVDIEFVWW